MIILEDINFEWSTSDIARAIDMWKNKESIIEIAKAFNRDPDEVLLLLLHLARQRKIKKRKVNLYGRKMKNNGKRKNV
jgi:hypothetical protein